MIHSLKPIQEDTMKLKIPVHFSKAFLTPLFLFFLLLSVCDSMAGPFKFENFMGPSLPAGVDDYEAGGELTPDSFEDVTSGARSKDFQDADSGKARRTDNNTENKNRINHKPLMNKSDARANIIRPRDIRIDFKSGKEPVDKTVQSSPENTDSLPSMEGPNIFTLENGLVPSGVKAPSRMNALSGLGISYFMGGGPKTRKHQASSGLAESGQTSVLSNGP
jgi:hypothetical protein